MKKYVIRLLATAPMLGAGASIIMFWVLSFDYPMFVIAAICSIFSFMVCAAHYEDTVKYIAKFLKEMSKEALSE